jgi:hypothetical protein
LKIAAKANWISLPRAKIRKYVCSFKNLDLKTMQLKDCVGIIYHEVAIIYRKRLTSHKLTKSLRPKTLG